MTKPIIGNHGEECDRCGKWYSEAKKNCPHCGEINPDYIAPEDRFKPRKNLGGTLAVREGILVKVYEDDPDL